MSAPAVSLVIPVFNQCGLTLQCLRALASTSASVPHEVIVVDNASTDATPYELARFGDAVRVIRNDANEGFAAACNKGAAAARGENLLFLNNDTIPFPGWLEPLLDEVRDHPEVVAVGAKLLFPDGLVQHAGVAFARETRNPFNLHRMLHCDDPRVNHRREMQALTAACLLIRPDWFARCGRFPEVYRNGYEDLDLCLAVRRRGGRLVYQPRSVLCHLQNQTSGRMRYDPENRSLFFLRWADSLLSDEDVYYYADGYRSLGRCWQQPHLVNLTRLATEDEKSRWAVVAEAQQLAAEGQMAEFCRRLTQWRSWPEDAAVHRWAGALCRLLQLPDAARGHFSLSLTWEDRPEVRLCLDADSPASPGWAGLNQARRLLREGDGLAALAAFDAALAQGAPPRLALPGLWQASARSAQSRETAQASQAMLAMPRIAPAVGDRLHLESRRLPRQSVASRPVFTSVIIAVHNQLAQLRPCLEHLAKSTPFRHEVIVVDNGSTDGTAAYLETWQEISPFHVVMRNHSPHSAAAVFNQGIAVARAGVLCLLRVETRLGPAWLASMQEVLRHRPDTGIVGPRRRETAEPPRGSRVNQQSGDAATTTAESGSTGLNERSAAGEAVEASCLLIDRRVVAQIGGFDPRFVSADYPLRDFFRRAGAAGFSTQVVSGLSLPLAESRPGGRTAVGDRLARLRDSDWYRQKWPADTPPQAGASATGPLLPKGVAVFVPLPVLLLTHDGSADGRLWTEKGRQVSVRKHSVTRGSIARARAIEIDIAIATRSISKGK